MQFISNSWFREPTDGMHTPETKLIDGEESIEPNVVVVHTTNKQLQPKNLGIHIPTV